MRTLDSSLSLIRQGPYELRVMKLCSQEATEELWLELVDHLRERTIDSYRGRDLEDIALAARSLGSKLLRRRDTHSAITTAKKSGEIRTPPSRDFRGYEG